MLGVVFTILAVMVGGMKDGVGGALMLQSEEVRIIDSDRFGVTVRTIMQVCIKFEESISD